ncbi:MAG: hypothetical protein CMJ77_22485 [Planctomycetaceae bacterium]|nr:hypothetical protein [Planctomycetaceae bacterium]
MPRKETWSIRSAELIHLQFGTVMNWHDVRGESRYQLSRKIKYVTGENSKCQKQVLAVQVAIQVFQLQ